LRTQTNEISDTFEVRNVIGQTDKINMDGSIDYDYIDATRNEKHGGGFISIKPSL
jgi:hypothetical protein